MMAFFNDPELNRLTLEVLGLALISLTVASVISRRRSLSAGVLLGFLVALILWMAVLFVEFRFFYRFA